MIYLFVCLLASQMERETHEGTFPVTKKKKGLAPSRTPSIEISEACSEGHSELAAELGLVPRTPSHLALIMFYQLIKQMTARI